MKNGLPSARSMIRRLSETRSLPSPRSSGQHFLGGFLAERIESQLCVVSFAAPLMRVLGAIVYQQQDFCGSDRVGEQVQESLRLLVDPMQVLEYHHQRLVEALAHEDALDGFQGAALANLRVHMRKRVVTFDDAEQRKEVRECVFERAIQREYPSVHLLTPGALIVIAGDLEVARVEDRSPAGMPTRLPCEAENVSNTIQPDCKTALNSRNRRDLPTPGSAIAATICP